MPRYFKSTRRTERNPVMRDISDVVIFRPTEDLVRMSGYGTGPAPNPRRKKRPEPAFGPEELYAGNARFLVRTALIRSDEAMVEPRPVIHSPYDAALLCSHLVFADQEHLVILTMDAANRLSAIFESAIGGTSEAGQTALHLIKVPLLVSAAATVMVHNHPGGDATPSGNDLSVADKFEKSLECIGCTMMDFMIVAENGYWSRMFGKVEKW